MALSQVTKAFIGIPEPNIFTYVVLTAGQVIFYAKPVKERFIYVSHPCFGNQFINIIFWTIFSFSPCGHHLNVSDDDTKGSINVCRSRLLSMLISIWMHLFYKTMLCRTLVLPPTCYGRRFILSSSTFELEMWVLMTSVYRLKLRGEYLVQQIFLCFHLRIHSP